MITTEVERVLLEDRIRRDTVWCFRCGLQHRQIRAVCCYAVPNAEPGQPPYQIPACRVCFDRAWSDGIAIMASEPATQPPHVDLLTRLLH